MKCSVLYALLWCVCATDFGIGITQIRPKSTVHGNKKQNIDNIIEPELCRESDKDLPWSSNRMFSGFKSLRRSKNKKVKICFTETNGELEDGTAADL